MNIQTHQCSRWLVVHMGCMHSKYLTNDSLYMQGKGYQTFVHSGLEAPSSATPEELEDPIELDIYNSLSIYLSVWEESISQSYT